MICPYCKVPMEEEVADVQTLHFVLEDFPFEDDEEVLVTYWHCVICDYVDETYDA